MNQAIQEFIDGKRVAVVGASRQGNKFGNIAAKELGQRGYQVYIVHPEAKEIDGQPCYANLEAVHKQVDGVLVSVPPQQGMNVLKDAAAVGLRNVWVQQQGDSPDLIALGESLDLNLVTGKCILMYAPPVRSFHAWHRGFMRLVGKL